MTPSSVSGAGRPDCDRLLLIPCEAPGAEGLTIIWDRQAEQVIDVMSLAEQHAYFPENDL